jgi:hypothetical protein
MLSSKIKMGTITMKMPIDYSILIKEVKMTSFQLI